jgi:hypothetical protein
MAPRSWPFGSSWSLPAARHWRPSPTKVNSRAGLGHSTGLCRGRMTVWS